MGIWISNSPYLILPRIVFVFYFVFIKKSVFTQKSRRNILQRMYYFSRYLQEHKTGGKKNKVSNIRKHKYYKEFGTYLNFYINYFGIVFTKE